MTIQANSATGVALGAALISLGLSCNSCVSGDAAASVGKREKLVVTHVMHQLGAGAVNSKNETHLSVEPSRANGVMALHTQEYIANYGKPMEAARQDVAMMKATGVDAMGLLYSPGHIGSKFGPMIDAYYKAALEDGKIKIYPDWLCVPNAPDPDQPGAPAVDSSAKLAADLGTLLARYGGTWLKRDGRLVVSFWTNYGSGKLPPCKETLEKILSKIGGRSNVFLVLYSPRELKRCNPEWFAEANAFTDWLTESYGPSHDSLPASLSCAREAGKEFWSPVMPSFQQSRYPHENGKFVPNAREKLGATWFRESWMTAIEEGASVAALQTWNDLSEDSSVMPESNHGQAYYELNKFYAQWFKAGTRPVVEKERLFVFHHPQIVEGVRLPEGVKPMEGFPVSHGKSFNAPFINRTPPSDYVEVVAMLKAPAKISVMLNETVIAERELPAGGVSWLVYEPRQLNDPRRLYSCNPETAYPKEAGDFLVTKIEKPFFDAELYVAASRGQERLGFFRSHRPIVAAAGRGDLCAVGDVFELER